MGLLWQWQELKGRARSKYCISVFYFYSEIKLILHLPSDVATEQAMLLSLRIIIILMVRYTHSHLREFRILQQSLL